ncbi:hypothetical protein BDR07DRAFT_1422592 [Suillus spraguei]|nr:hypothetical protein BDR07DRAFT_1422592 [Suillus spraguei]
MNRVGFSMVLLDLLFVICLNRSMLVKDSYGLGVVFPDFLRRGAHVTHSTPTHRGPHLHPVRVRSLLSPTSRIRIMRTFDRTRIT